MAAGGATTVSDRPDAARTAPPTVAGLRNVPAAARLLLAGAAAQTGNDTVVPSGEPAVTRVARSVAASVAQRGGAGRGRVDAITGALGGGAVVAGTAGAAGAVGETTFRAGEVAVLALPNAARDVVADGPRPRLVVTGTPTRVVALRRGGEVALDETVDGAEVEVPRGVERLALAPLGAGAVPPSAAGWHAGMTLPYVGWGTALGVEATVRVEGPPVARRGDRFRAGWVEAAELVSGNASVITRFSRPVDLVVVVIDDPVADAGRRLLLGLDGARQALGPDGQPLPPTTVAAGNRAILAYRIDVDPAAAVPVTVTVASGTGWHLVGVLGATGAPADVVAALAARGFDSVVGAAVPPGRGEATVAWAPAGSPPVDLTPPAPPAPPDPPGGPPSGPVTPPVGPVTPPVGPVTPPVGPVTPPVGPIGPVHPAHPGPPPVGPHLPTTGPITHPVVTEEPAEARGAPSAPAQPDPKAEKKKAKKKKKSKKSKKKRS